MPTLGSLDMSPSVIDSHDRGSMSVGLDSPFGGSRGSQRSHSPGFYAGVAEIQSTNARESANGSAEEVACANGEAEEVACANGEAQAIGIADDQAVAKKTPMSVQRGCLRQ